MQRCCFLGSKPVYCCLLAKFELLQAKPLLHNISIGLAATPPHGNISFGLAAVPPHSNISFTFSLAAVLPHGNISSGLAAMSHGVNQFGICLMSIINLILPAQHFMPHGGN
jgi:hypothetical protein